MLDARIRDGLIKNSSDVGGKIHWFLTREDDVDEEETKTHVTPVQMDRASLNI
jgi:hypothetical protein